jgi:hypothetical protein
MTSRDNKSLLQLRTLLAYRSFVGTLLPFHTAGATGSIPVPPTKINGLRSSGTIRMYKIRKTAWKGFCLADAVQHTDPLLCAMMCTL